MGLAEQILAADQTQSLKVHVPEWGCDVWIRTLALGDRQAWELEALRNHVKGIEGIDEFRSRYLAMSLVDADGKQLLTNEQLKTIDGKVGARLYDVAYKHNDIDPKVVEDIGKN